jgi:hypothetical protein
MPFESFYNLLRFGTVQLLSLDPASRLKSPAAIKSCDFFAGLDWSKVRARALKPVLIIEPANYDTLDPASTMVAELKVGKFRGFSFVEP